MAEFRDFGTLFTKAFSYFQESGMKQTDNKDSESIAHGEDGKMYVYSSVFFQFC